MKKGLWYNMTHIGEIMPDSFDYYEDENTCAFRIRQPKNCFVPEEIDYYEDKKKGVLRLSTRNQVSKVLNKTRNLKRIERDDYPIDEFDKSKPDEEWG